MKNFNNYRDNSRVRGNRAETAREREVLQGVNTLGRRPVLCFRETACDRSVVWQCVCRGGMIEDMSANIGYSAAHQAAVFIWIISFVLPNPN